MIKYSELHDRKIDLIKEFLLWKGEFTNDDCIESVKILEEGNGVIKVHFKIVDVDDHEYVVTSQVTINISYSDYITFLSERIRCDF